MKKSELKALIKKSKEQLLATAAKFQCPESMIEVRHWDKINKILEAKSPIEAQEIQVKALDSFYMHCLNLWGKRKIDGPLSADSLMKKANQAINLAKFQSSLGHDEQAKKQLDRAEGLRQRAEALRGESRNDQQRES